MHHKIVITLYWSQYICFFVCLAKQAVTLVKTGNLGKLSSLVHRSWYYKLAGRYRHQKIIFLKIVHWHNSAIK